MKKRPTAYVPREDGQCLCGCGQLTAIATKTWRAAGWTAGKPKPFLPHHKPPRISLESQWVVQPNGCWRWTGATTVDGYAIVTRQNRRKLVHILTWETKHGQPWPAGQEADHLCHTRDSTCPGGPGCLHRRCVNPDDIEPVTDFENARRGVRTVLTWQQIRAIRALQGEIDFREVAAMFHIKHPTYIHKIWSRAVWKE